MRLRIGHPSRARMTAVVGHDHAIDWFAEIRNKGKVVYEFDAVSAGEATTLQEVLDALVEYGFFSEATLHAALEELPHHLVAEIADPAIRRVAEIVEQLRSAAADG